MQHSLTVNTAMQERRVWLVLQPARRKAQQKKHGPLTAKPARSTGSRISRLILGERLAKATNDSAERVIRQTGSSVTSLCEALELGSICKGVLQTWARESQFMRLATLFAFSAAAVSALTSGGKEATKRLQVWDSGRRPKRTRRSSWRSPLVWRRSRPSYRCGLRLLMDSVPRFALSPALS